MKYLRLLNNYFTVIYFRLLRLNLVEIVDDEPHPRMMGLQNV